MSVATFPTSSSHAVRGLAATLALWLVGVAAANAHEIAADAISGLAGQKIDGVTLIPTPLSVAFGSSAVPTGADFSARTSTTVAFDTPPSGWAHDDGLVELRSFVFDTMPLRAVETVSGNTSPDRSPSAGAWILRQLEATVPGFAGGFDLATPQATEFLAGRSCARRDGHATPNPDAYPVSRSKSGTIPSGCAANGNQVCAAPLSSAMDPQGTPSTNHVAEAVLHGEGVAMLASNASEQASTGNFHADGPVARAAGSLDYDLVQRLVVHSWNPEIDLATASDAFALDIGDATGRSVFGPFLGANPSAARMISGAVRP